MKLYIDFDEFEPWAGAVETWEKIKEANKIDELEFYLDDIYPKGMTDTQLNDLLWFESDTVFDWLGIKEEEDFTEEFDEFCSHFSSCEYCPLYRCLNVTQCSFSFEDNKDKFMECIKDEERDEYNESIID